MVKGEGEFSFNSLQGQEECVIYFIADIDEILQIRLVEKNFDCKNEEVNLINGWIHKGQPIPKAARRSEQLCSTNNSYLTTQNAAMISIKMKPGSSFVISILTENTGKGY